MDVADPRGLARPLLDEAEIRGEIGEAAEPVLALGLGRGVFVGPGRDVVGEGGELRAERKVHVDAGATDHEIER